MANHRIDRVGMEIKREVNEILHKKVRDPRVQDVTITDVQMLGDLSMAKVYYTIHSDLASDNQKAQIGLEKATGTIKRELGRNLTKCFVIWRVKTKRLKSSLTSGFFLCYNGGVF